MPVVAPAPMRPTAERMATFRRFVRAIAMVDDSGLPAQTGARAALVGIRPSTAKRHLADLRARSGLTTEQLIYCGRAEGWLVVPSLEPA